MFLVYSVLLSLGLVLTAPYYLWRLRGKTGASAGWRERFGLLPPEFQQAQKGAVWIHAVSVGETLAVAGLAGEIGRRYPGRKIFMSHVTPAGREVGESRLPSVAGRFYLPLDWGHSVRRAFACIRPALLVLVETELWPNLLRVAHEFGARIIVVNARISDRSFRRYCWARPFMRRVLESVDRVCAQTEDDAEKFRRLGAKPASVVVTGNLKFEGKPPQLSELTEKLKKALRGLDRGPVIVAASTMPGEEPLLLPAWEKVRDRHPRALLILAPRHPARFDSVAQLLAGKGRSFVRRTALRSDENAMGSQLAAPEILLLDTIGELAGIFEMAEVVFMGGSLVPTGGHNLLEPAFWGRPILHGPHMENFRDISRLFSQAGAAVQVRDAEELGRRFLALLQDDARRRELGERARQVVEQEAGATPRVLEHIRALLAAEDPHPGSGLRSEAQ